MLHNYKLFVERNHQLFLEQIDQKKEYDHSPEYKERAFKKFRRAVITMTIKFGFFADLLFSLKVLMTYEVETMATDGIYLLFNPQFVLEELGQAEVLFVIAHELMHCMLLHMSRRGVRDPLTWNYAGDYAINLILDDGGSGEQCGKKPDGALWDKKYENMSADKIYDLLVKENPPQQKPPPQPPQEPKIGDYIMVKKGKKFGKIKKINLDGTYDYDIVTSQEVKNKLK